MMAVMFLRARVPNDGAHRLAWAIGMRPTPAMAIRELEGLLGINTVDRLLEGSLTPGQSEGDKIERWSGGAICASDFYKTTSASWGDQPSYRKIPGRWRMAMPGRVAERGSSLRRRWVPERLPRQA